VDYFNMQVNKKHYVLFHLRKRLHFVSIETEGISPYSSTNNNKEKNEYDNLFSIMYTTN